MKLLRWLRLVAPIMLLALMAPLAQAEPAGASAAQQQAQQTPYATLADMLENEQTRHQLIEQLRQLAQGDSTASGGPQAVVDQAGDAGGVASSPGTEAASTGQETASFGGRIAEFTQHFAQEFSGNINAAFAAFKRIGSGEGAGVPLQQWLPILLAFAIAVVATVAAFLLLRRLVMPIYRRIDGWVARQPATGHRQGSETGGEAHDEPAQAGTTTSGRKRRRRPRHGSDNSAVTLLKRFCAVLGALLIDVVIILLAGAAGYAVSLYGAGETGSIGRAESLFINAFAMIEIAKALIRMVFSSRYDNLRLFPMPAEIASYWNRWLARLVGITGYGLLVAVPFVNAMFSPALGQLLGLIVMLGVYIHAVRVILKNRWLLRDRLFRKADLTQFAVVGTLLRMLARIWHICAIAYFTVLLVVSQLEPQDALPFMARATVQTLLAIGVGVLLSSLLTALLARRIHLSEDMRHRLPMLEARINSYVPAALKGLRALLTFFVVLVILDAWHAFDLPAWIVSDSGAKTIGVIVHVAIILFIAALLWTVAASIIENRLSTAAGRTPSAREQTLLSLFRNAILILIVTMTILIVLAQIGIDIGPLIAGAGVVGLAIGFGAQKLVQDIITGVFIQLENAMNTGDVVGAAGLTGTAERITIRSVGLRALDGTYHVIPFSSVDTVSNYMRGFAYHVGEYAISYRENVDNAIEHLHQAFDELKQNEELAPSILEDMTVPGVVALGDSSVNIRIMIKTAAGMQWAIQREFNKLVKKHFDAAGIEIPYPHTTLYFGQDKNGGAPPVHVHKLDSYEVPEGQAGAAGQTPSVKKPKRSGRQSGQAKNAQRHRNNSLGEQERLPDENGDAGSDSEGER